MQRAQVGGRVVVQRPDVQLDAAQGRRCELLGPDLVQEHAHGEEVGVDGQIGVLLPGALVAELVDELLAPPVAGAVVDAEVDDGLGALVVVHVAQGHGQDVGQIGVFDVPDFAGRQGVQQGAAGRGGPGVGQGVAAFGRAGGDLEAVGHRGPSWRRGWRAAEPYARRPRAARGPRNLRLARSGAPAGSIAPFVRVRRPAPAPPSPGLLRVPYRRAPPRFPSPRSRPGARPCSTPSARPWSRPSS